MNGISTTFDIGNFIHHQVVEKNKKKTIYNKHQDTTDMPDNQAGTHMGALKMHDLKMTDKENYGSGKCRTGK